MEVWARGLWGRIGEFRCFAHAFVRTVREFVLAFRE